MSRKIGLFIAVPVILAIIAACTQVTATPVVKVETVVVKETVPVEVEVVVTREVEKVVEKVVTVEVPKEVTVVKTVEVEKEVTVVKTVEVEKEVPVVETVEVVKVVTVVVQVTPTPTPEPTADRTHPKVREILSQVTLVQHHYDPDAKVDSFTCASRGKGILGVKTDPRGPRYVGPNAADFDLWGVSALFKVDPDGKIELVPEQSGGKFTDLEGIEHSSFPLEQALELFASGDAKWLGAHGQAGRIGECDPQYATATPTS